MTPSRRFGLGPIAAGLLASLATVQRNMVTKAHRRAWCRISVALRANPFDLLAELLSRRALLAIAAGLMLLLAPPAQALGVGGLIAGAIKYLDSYAPMPAYT